MIHGKVKLDVYKRSVYWFYGELEDFKKKYKVTLDGDYNYADGLSFMNDGNSYIFIKQGADIYEVVPHEVLHSVLDIAECVGIKADFNNQEPLAYLVGHINCSILKKLHGKCKQKTNNI